MSSNKKKSNQLDMPFGTASGRLRKKVLFNLLAKFGENICFQCGEPIENEGELSMEHKIAWLDNSPDLFWDLDNIAFSHMSCNYKAAKRPSKGRRKHPSHTAYRNGCRCDECREIEKFRRRRQRKAVKEGTNI